MSSSRPIMQVIGMGNPLRGDDGAGPAIVEALKARGLPGVQLMTCHGDGLPLIDTWKSAGRVMLIDAATSGANPGTIYRFDALSQALPASLSFYSSHTFGAAETIELARTLGQLPPHLVVYAIEGKNFALGAGLSPEVEHAVREVVERVVDEVNQITAVHTSHVQKSAQGGA